MLIGTCKLNVPEEDVKKALLLIRDLRIEGIRQNINPVAMRIALKFALATDTHWAKYRITPEQDHMINLYVEKLLKEVMR